MSIVEETIIGRLVQNGKYNSEVKIYTVSYITQKRKSIIVSHITQKRKSIQYPIYT